MKKGGRHGGTKRGKEVRGRREGTRAKPGNQLVYDISRQNTSMASRQLAMAEWHQQYENQTICELVSCIALFHWLNEC